MGDNIKQLLWRMEAARRWITRTAEEIRRNHGLGRAFMAFLSRVATVDTRIYDEAVTEVDGLLWLMIMMNVVPVAMFAVTMDNKFLAASRVNVVQSIVCLMAYIAAILDGYPSLLQWFRALVRGG